MRCVSNRTRSQRNREHCQQAGRRSGSLLGVQRNLGAHQGIRNLSAAQRVVVEADGGSRGNPGPAGYGAVVFSADRSEVLAERRAALGIATNNVAEYRGLIAALAAAADVGAREVEVRMDSKLVVEQMSGRWKVKHPDMIPLQRKAAELARQFDSVTYEWIPRAQNSHADALANEAMDAAAEGVDLTELPDAEPVATAEPAAKKPESPGWTGAVGEPTRLLLLRHGQTPMSVDRRYSGRGNPDLTELGRRQADSAATALGSRTDIDAIVASPLARAQQTATATARSLGLPVTTVDGLIETDFGDWEGLTFTEAMERHPDVHKAWRGDTSVAPPNGESFDAVRVRIEATRDQLLTEYAGKTVLVVTHVTPIKMLLQLALDVGPSLLYRLHLDLAALSIAEFYPDGGASVRLVNDTSHLAGLG
ncbi:bifunctional RNase H/acid phosphatase [Rhodococcus fascians]|nr:bifunctional RNase H/acid phosphatase [Rhodococcus fascians]MBY4396413.1 bifunctional RNase H/acid phosphatase [Rhodococcus fascians]MBY4409065.1 bifunctional RNase H/acid phosphatase [Rhodococcus fascians]MBY4420909.1 bifunctional RNase H/acid phosphatase [Rhodococcus fascians]MBY4460268.1 bifunctional RNase H/acid phosphatase [Rhodococcus fascians]